LADAELGALKVHQDASRAAFAGAHPLGELEAVSPGSVAAVEPGHVHAGILQKLDILLAGLSRAKGADDLGAPHWPISV